ncbi:hypothetical protein OH491_22050 [Termitidicoccus mucosus]|uniref:hypothetical protein n=1 Tax=Termitidicoccus mucosus TaxID=1184151 RepID=UPI003183C1EB
MRAFYRRNARVLKSPGDRLQVKFNGNSREGHRINNGELVTVQSIADDGAVVATRGNRENDGARPAAFRAGMR